MRTILRGKREKNVCVREREREGERVSEPFLGL